MYVTNAFATPAITALINNFTLTQTEAGQENFIPQLQAATITTAAASKINHSPLQLLPTRGFLIFLAHTESARHEVAAFQVLLHENKLATERLHLANATDCEYLAQTDPKTRELIQELEAAGIKLSNIYLIDLAAYRNQGFRERLMELDSTSLFSAAYTLPSGKFPRQLGAAPQEVIIAAINQLEQLEEAKHSSINAFISELKEICIQHRHVIALSEHNEIIIIANGPQVVLELLAAITKQLSLMIHNLTTGAVPPKTFARSAVHAVLKYSASNIYIPTNLIRILDTNLPGVIDNLV